jgi:hypothetical protein
MVDELRVNELRRVVIQRSVVSTRTSSPGRSRGACAPLLEASGKLLHLFRVVLSGMSHATAVPFDEHTERCFAVDLHNAMFWEGREVALLALLAA